MSDTTSKNIDEIKSRIYISIENEDKNALLELLDYIENIINDYNEQINKLECEILEIEKSGRTLKADKIHKLELISNRDDLKFYYDSYIEFKNTILSALNSSKNFNKFKTIANIRYLLKEKPDVKIGMIEKNANVGAGYLSRIDKVGNMTDPSIEFIVTASKMLNIPIDYLVFSDIEKESQDLTPNDMTVFQFINSLYEDTINGIIDWSEYSLTKIEKHYIMDNNYNAFPLLYCRSEDADGRGQLCQFKSAFWSKFNWDVIYSIYETRLNRLNSKIYLIPIRYQISDMEFADEYEIYIFQNETLIPLCSSYKIKKYIKDKIFELYRKIKTYNSGIQLNMDAKSFLDSYLNINYNDLPFK